MINLAFSLLHQHMAAFAASATCPHFRKKEESDKKEVKHPYEPLLTANEVWRAGICFSKNARVIACLPKMAFSFSYYTSFSYVLPVWDIVDSVDMIWMDSAEKATPKFFLNTSFC